ncbi:glycosyltransferase family 2 protein [Candidatus Shapirobacteria bacterium]|nr:glycosyltransferase family 2 protein [Candidatus Shapirobacteria bacterium]
MDIFVVIPVYNEKSRVVSTVMSVLANSKNKVVVVDDGSSDGCDILLKDAFDKNKRVTLVKHDINQGKGMAMKTGAKVAWKNGAEAVIFIDADGQHDPKLISKFVDSLKSGDEVVIGVRINKGQMTMIRKFGNWMIRVVLAILYGQTIEDMLCGYRAMTKRAYSKVVWTSHRYGVETEMICNMWKYGLNYRKIVVETIYAKKKERKRDCFTPVDGIKVLLLIPYWRWRNKSSLINL